MRKAKRGHNEGHKWESQEHNVASLRCPENFPGASAARRSCGLEGNYRFGGPHSAQDIIHIVAELGWPTQYPNPDSRVTTTLYA
jgi:hypothetical protein